MDPQSPFLIPTFDLVGPLWPHWATVGPHVAQRVHKMSSGSHFGRFGAYFGPMLEPFWMIWGRVCNIWDVLGQLLMIRWIRRYAVRGTTNKKNRAKQTIKVLQIFRYISETYFNKSRPK